MKPNVTFETNQILLTKSLTRRGLGITLFLEMVISEDPDLVAVSLNPPIYLELALAWKKRTYFSKANQAFLDFFINYRY
ncbi:LysR family transcriptional regulator substrate-binding protein, partial [Rhizobium ruizarguesonis]